MKRHKSNIFFHFATILVDLCNIAKRGFLFFFLILQTKTLRQITNIYMSEKKTPKILFGEKLGYSLGDVAANLVFQMMMVFQLKFYTDVFGLEGAIAGSVFLIACLSGAFVDPFVGILCDRTQTRWGKYRPWVLWSALPLCVFYVLAFRNPGIEDKALVALYATVSYVLLMVMYACSSIPYSSLGGVMTGSIKERTSINTVRFIAVSLSMFFVQGLTLPLVNKFGGAEGKVEQGWLTTICLFALIAFIFLLITFFTTRERIQPPLTQVTSLKEDVRGTIANLPWRSIFVLVLFIFITISMWGAAMNYYFQYNLDQKSLYDFLATICLTDDAGEREGIWYSALGSINLIAHSPADAYSIGFSLFNMIGAVVQLLGIMLLSEHLANKYGKKQTFIVCLSLTAFFTALFYMPSPVDISFVFGLCIFKSLAFAPTVPLLWAMIGDVADHVEYVNHRRATGFCFSGMSFALKAGLGLGGALAGMILSCFGYVSGLNNVQSTSALVGIRLVSSVVPALLFCIGIIALLYYPITKTYNEKMQAALAARRRQSIVS